MKRLGIVVLGLLGASGLWAAESLFNEDFSKVAPGPLPEEFLVLDGQFGVKEEAGNRFVELPGAPLESYGFIFGSNHPNNVEISARIYGTRSGRKFPTFGVGSNGASGYRLQVSPAKGTVELMRGDVSVASAPFAWKSGEWTELRLAVRRVSDTELKIEGNAWSAGGEAPKAPLVSYSDPKPQPAGKASVWGMPFSGTPIRFDDLKVTRIGGS
ncbi:MAG TPA: hypothetical protein PLX89_06700 [Verrucomicrobiota bacterium]|nr:hypothetical protein [Verrucomicrobiales bacterium]HRI12681.1 hypothetical protein [Verrucomicrobiota bacterium]